jgi:hypothetical protein
MKDDMRKLLELFADPVWLAEQILRSANHEASRTDPWRWHCRLCGTEGEADSEQDRDRDAYGHLNDWPCDRRLRIGTAVSGRLRHVWRYGPPA